MFQVKPAKTDEETQPTEAAKRFPIPKIVLMAGSAVVVVIMIIVAVIFSLKQDGPLSIFAFPNHWPRPQIPIPEPGSVNMLTNGPLRILLLLAKARPLVSIVIIAVLIFMIVGVTLGVVLINQRFTRSAQIGGRNITNDEPKIDQVSEESFWQRNMWYVIGFGGVIILICVVIIAAKCWPTTEVPKPKDETLEPPAKPVIEEETLATVVTNDKTLETPVIEEETLETVVTNDKTLETPLTPVTHDKTLETPLTDTQPATTNEERLMLVNDLRNQIDALRKVKFTRRISDKTKYHVIDLQTGSNTQLLVPTKLAGAKDLISDIGTLNRYRINQLCHDDNDYRVILSWCHICSSKKKNSPIWDLFKNHRLHYLNLEKEGLPKIEEEEWEALQDLHNSLKNPRL